MKYRTAIAFRLALLTAASAIFVAGFTGQTSAQDRPPNIVLILADDLGYGDLGSYGQQRIKTPHLDQLARGGMRFTNFYAGSTVCAPSRCGLMTGYHMGHALIRGNGKDNLRPQDVTIAEVLKHAGYQTGLTGKWGLGHEGSTGVPTRQGFDYFYGYLDQHHAHNYYPSFLMRNEQRVALDNVVPGEGDFGQGVASNKVQYSHDLITEQALQFIERNQEDPFFLYLAYTIPHANNEAGQEGMEVSEYGAYEQLDWPEPQKGHAAMITRMDRDIGQLMARLEALDLAANTLIMFSSDNGPHREGGNDPDFADSNGPLRGIKRDLTDGGIRVPLIAWWPGKVPAGTTSDFVGALWDVMPTLADLAGVEQHVPRDIDGISFAPALLGQSQEQQQHDFLYWAFYERGGGQAGRSGDWKAVQQPIDTPVRLYNVQEDIGEQHDVSQQFPDITRRMTEQMQAAHEPSQRWQFPKAAGGGPFSR